jgi:hypothetical protein
MTTIEEKKFQRFKFLKTVYEASKGDEHNWVDMWKIGNYLSLDRETTEQVTQYLIGEGLIAFQALGGVIGITHRGIIEIEDALSTPDRATRYFPPVNIINVGQMINSQIQQSSAEANQTQQVEVKSIDIEHLIREMKDAATQILTKDVTALKGFSERQIKNIAQQAAFIEQGISSGEITAATKDFFLDNLKDMVRNFIRTLQGLAIVTIEKLWNAIIGVIWKAIGTATNITLSEIGSFA